MPTIFTQSWSAVGSQLTITLSSLAASGWQQSDEVDNSSLQWLDAHLFVTVMTTGAAVTSAGTVEVYGFGQVGQSTVFRTDTMGATNAAVGGVQNARLIGVIQANSNSTMFAAGPFSVANAFGGILPYKWGIVVGNKTGAALSGSSGVNQIFFIGYQEKGV